ncbi:MAG TPA: AbgT family transporter [Phycisphaerales bacterium]|nr:AbgT family transporter [Phycisphaerales bacterium]
MTTPPSPSLTPSAPRRSFLDWVEVIGNKLPEPVLLFAMLAIATVLVSGVGTWAGWSVQPVRPRVVMVEKVGADGVVERDAAGAIVMVPKVNPATGRPEVVVEANGDPLKVQSLMTRDGIYWALSSMIRNFVNFPPLGLVLTGMLGIGLAEKVGLFATLMKWLASVTPKKLLTPMIVLIGANASIASDAGYIILPPLAAGLYAVMGRHPLAGMSAAFAGVAGGFGAGVFITAADTVLCGVAEQSAHLLDGGVKVLPTVNWTFKIASAPLIALVGWFVADKIVEPRLSRTDWRSVASEEAAAIQTGKFAITPMEKRGLLWALTANVAVLAVFGAMVFFKSAPLHGDGLPTLPNGQVAVQHAVDVKEAKAEVTAPAHDVLAREPLTVVEKPAKGRLVEGPGARWSHVIVPMMFFAFLAPGIAYGIVTGAIKNQNDLVAGFYSAMKSMAPVIAMNFFAAQFLAYFSFTNLDRMLAFAGGAMLVKADLPVPLLLVLFVLFIIVADFAMSSMTAKFTLLAPILIPMFMMVGVGPALMIGGYRIGDSVVNVITPLNTYLPIILLVLQRYQRNAGMGSLMALMVPYSVAFGVCWTGLLLLWYWTGAPLGPGGDLHYTPPQ